MGEGRGDAMFKNILTTSEHLHVHVGTYVPKNYQGWGEIIFGGGRGQSVALFVILVKT